MKEIAKTWWFHSSSGSGNYETLQYTDGSITCGCPGWCKRVDSKGNRSCKHTRMVEGGIADEESFKHVAKHEVTMKIEVTTTKPAMHLGFRKRNLVLK